MLRTLFLISLVACGGKDEPDKTTTPPPATNRDSGGGGSTITGFAPDAFTIYAFFGVDETGRLHEWTEGGNPVLPQVSIAIYEEADTPPCVVTFFMDNPSAVALQPWSFDDETPGISPTLMDHVGFHIPSDATVQTDGCTAWNDEVYGDVEALIGGIAWGAGVGTLRSDIEEVVNNDPNAEWLKELHDAGTLVGASWDADLWYPNTWASHTAYAGQAPGWAYETDAKKLPLTPLSAAEIQATPGSLPVGVYTIQPLYLWDWDTYIQPRV